MRRKRSPNRRLGLVACVAVAAATLVPRSEAASFACSAATTPREKLICANPALSSADEKLAAAYKAVLEGLSEEGRAESRKSEARWLSYIDIVCSTRRAPPPSSSARCLEEEYAKRRKQLEGALVKAGGLTIRRVDIFKATPSEPHDDGRHPNFTTTTIAYPLIDNPHEAGEKHWNELMRATDRSSAWSDILGDAAFPGDAAGSGGDADDAENGDDLDGSYRLGSVSPALISVMLSSYGYPHGAAHGMHAETMVTWLPRENRALGLEDVFAKGRPWQAALARLVFDSEKHAEGDDFAVDKPSAIAAATADPAHWLITDRALVVRFSLTDAGLNGVGGVEADIPWSALKPYLSAKLPFPIEGN